MAVFRAIWPIYDPTMPYDAMLQAAIEELPDVAARSHARITGRGRFTIAPSSKVPGSGRVTDTVLVYEADADPLPRRPYHRQPTTTRPPRASGLQPRPAGPGPVVVDDVVDGPGDPVVVERILAGDPVPANQAERLAVIAAWTALGRPLAHLEQLTGWNTHRYKTRLAVPA